jgi:hypothetical protein
MDKAKRAQTAETLKQPSPGLTLRAPYLYPDPGKSLQPEATGAVMEVTKWLKPSDSFLQYSQAVRSMK